MSVWPANACIDWWKPSRQIDGFATIWGTKVVSSYLFFLAGLALGEEYALALSFRVPQAHE